MNIQIDEQLALLLARVDDLLARADRGEVCYTAFLAPREQLDLREWLQRRGKCSTTRFWGGYAEAERRCLVLFPEYIAELCDPSAWDTQPISVPLSYAGEDDPICVLSIRGSGYRELTHRDYLGSLLSLGIEREVIGDIDVPDGNHALVFCRTSMADYIVANLERIGNDKVKVEKTTVPPDFCGSRRRQPISDTVASARLDCVVAALANLSRDTAQSAIRDGRVELNFREELRVDRVVEPPCPISVRGIGKFNVLSIATQTKKGRWRLVGEKYV